MRASSQPSSAAADERMPPLRCRAMETAVASRVMTSSDSVRIDRWLCAARIFKSRTQAAAACEAGHVRVNEVSARASTLVRVGDEVAARAPRGRVVLKVAALEAKRQPPARARELYEDRSPPPSRDEHFFVAPRRKGRPTKSERRATDRLRGLTD